MLNSLFDVVYDVTDGTAFVLSLYGLEDFELHTQTV